ncbi:MAG: T9SS type A sorting domain-containing protein [Bacteroidota bacterium]
MKRRNAISITIGIIVLLSSHSGLSQKKELTSDKGMSGPVSNRLSNSEMGLLNINNISVWMRRDGWSGRIPGTGNPGTVYPRGTAGVVFQDGMLWSGIVDDTRDTSLPRLRVGGQTYNIGTRPGWITTPGTPTAPPLAIDPDHPRARIYKIRRDWQNLTTTDPDIVMETAEFNNISPIDVTPQMAQAIINQYVLDWNEWPGDLGAPFYDLNANGIWDAGIDRPGLQNADQVMWFVINDVDSIATRLLYGSPSIGLEVQMTLWGYKADGVFGQAMYRRTRMINKSGFSIDSMYVCQWSDPDLGDWSNDFTGSDTVLHTTFVYNGQSTDKEYGRFSLPPAAVGYALLQGPVVPTGNVQDTALFDFRKLPGKKNHPMTAQTYAGSGGFADPPLGQYQGTLQWYNLLRGLERFDGSPFIHPLTPGIPSSFWLDGDPLTGTGRIDGYIDAPGDRRITLSTGPFTVMNGDTQEVVIALVGGIRHTGNHLTSFAEMKQNVVQLRSFYGKQFDVPDVARWISHPTDTTTQLHVQADLSSQSGPTGASVSFSPEVGSEPLFSVQLFDDGLHDDSVAGDGIWGNSIVKRNAKYPVKGDLVVHTPIDSIVFYGSYGNIALRPTPVLNNFRVVWENGQQDSSLNHGETVHAAFDIFNPDGINAIDTLRITNLSFGSDDQEIIYNTGIAPNATVSSSLLFLISIGPDTGNVHTLSYRIRSDYASSLLSSPVPVVAWTPGLHWGDTLEVTSLHGSPDNVKPVIAEESQLTGHAYLISFFQGVTDVHWRLHDRITGQLKWDNGVISADPDYPHPVIDGVQYRVIDGLANPGVKDFLTVANAAGPLAPPEGAAATFAGFPVFADPTERQQVGPAEWLIHTGSFGSGDVSYAGWFVQRVFRGDNFSRFVPYDFELRFTATGGKAWLAFTTGEVIDVPFEIWNTGIDTPDDPLDDFRMIPWVNDADGNAEFNLQHIDHGVSGGSDDPYTDWIYWYEPTDRSPGETGYVTEFVNQGPGYDGTDGNGNDHDEVMARIVFVNWDGGNIPGPYNQLLPEEGTVFRITSRKPNFSGDSLEVVATPASVPVGEIPLSVHLYQNYPNPFNPVTTIRYGLVSRSSVELHIFNILGQRVRTLVNGEMEPGSHVTQWDARNEFGRMVASGVYFYHLKVKDFVQTRKMMLLR